MKINLTYNRENFEEIYFQDNQKNIFFGPFTKSSFKTFLLFLFVFLSVCVVSNFWSIHPTIIVMSFVFAFITLVGYIIALTRLIKRNKAVELQLNGFEKNISNILEVEEKSLIFKNAKNTSILAWDSFTVSRIMENYIELIGKDYVLIPKKSMTEPEFESLKKIIECKLK